MDAGKVLDQYDNAYIDKQINADQYRAQYFELYGKSPLRICECQANLDYFDDKLDDKQYSEAFDKCGTLSDKPVQPIWAYIGIGVGSLLLIGLLILILKPKSKK
jgi:hypothetical protein